MKIRPLISKAVVALAICALLLACNGGPPPTYDLILRGGTIYDGSGSEPYVGDLAIRGDEIAALGELGEATAPLELDVEGLAVAPGFVNMMSWANESLIEDGHSQSDICRRMRAPKPAASMGGYGS